jgi:hypothetical protein
VLHGYYLANIDSYAELPAEAPSDLTVPHCLAAAGERIASHQRAGGTLVDNDDGGAAWPPSCKYEAICRAVRRGTARPYGPHTAGQLLESEQRAIGELAGSSWIETTGTPHGHCRAGCIAMHRAARRDAGLPHGPHTAAAIGVLCCPRLVCKRRF